jgi:hypothetical protein
LGEKTQPRNKWDSNVDSDVLPQRFFGAVNDGREIGRHGARRLFPVHRNEKRSLSPSCRNLRNGRGDGGLPDAPLARDEQQTTVGNAQQF